jgi:hypothetical protein
MRLNTIEDTKLFTKSNFQSVIDGKENLSTNRIDYFTARIDPTLEKNLDKFSPDRKAGFGQLV